MPAVYEIVDERELPERARGEEGRMAWRLRTRHRLHARFGRTGLRVSPVSEGMRQGVRQPHSRT